MSAAAECEDLVSISRYLGFAPQNLFYLVAQRDKLYQSALIPKKNDPTKTRKIFIPCTELKGVQRQILDAILSEYEPSHSAYAYVKGRSLCMAAEKLLGTQSVLKLDLKNFFPSIGGDRVYGLFRTLDFNEVVSWVLTNLVIYKDSLCQGAPTSPYISNLICRTMDNDLSELANSWGLSYFRYSDDLFFYGPKYFRHKILTSYIRRTVGSHKFRINNQKTKYCPIGKPRFTLGLVTHNKQLQLPRKTRRNYRAAFFRAARNLNWARDNLDKLNGMAEWYRAVYGEDAQYREYRRTIDNVRHIMMHDGYVI